MSTTASSVAAPATKFEKFVAKYREDHKHPVNHVLHVGVGWPLCALGVICLPFRPWWCAGFFALGYAFMWFGHFVFERNLPTIFRHPSTPFVMAWAVILQIVHGLLGLVRPKRA